MYLALFHGSSTALVVRNTKAQMVTELDDNVTVAAPEGSGGQFLLDRTRELFALDCEVKYHDPGGIIKEYDDGKIDGDPPPGCPRTSTTPRTKSSAPARLFGEKLLSAPYFLLY